MLSTELEKVWGVKAAMVPMVNRELWAVTTKLNSCSRSMNNIQGLCLKDHSPRNGKAILQDLWLRS